MVVQAGELKHFIHTNMSFDLTWWPWLAWGLRDLVGIGGSWWSSGFTPAKYFQRLRGGWKIPAKTQALKSLPQCVSDRDPINQIRTTPGWQTAKHSGVVLQVMRYQKWKLHFLIIISYVAANRVFQRFKANIILFNFITVQTLHFWCYWL